MHKLKQRVWAALRFAKRRAVSLPASICGVRPDSGTTNSEIPTPDRILIINGGHIGDTMLASSILPVLRSAYPNVQIGLGVGSWSQKLFENHPDVAFTHVIDHWRLNRSGESLIRKLQRHMRTRRAALREIRELNYDVSLCIFPHEPNMLFFAWRAGIPRRIGFSGSVESPFATTLVEMSENPFIHQGQVYAEILRPLSIGEEHMRRRRVVLPASDASAEREVCDLLQVPCLEQASYRIIHIGSGNSLKELPPKFWRVIAQDLSRNGTLLFTGAGDRENRAIEEVISGLSNCVNGCGKLSWNGFVAAVRSCKLLYGVDTMAGHVAAAVGTRCIVVYHGMTGVPRWRPDTDNCIVFTNHVPCAPCFRPHGCSEMKCLLGVNPQDVLNADRSFPIHLQN